MSRQKPRGQDEIDQFIDGYVTELLISSTYETADTLVRVAHADPYEIHPDSWPTIYADCATFLHTAGTALRTSGLKHYDAGVSFVRTRNLAKDLTFIDTVPVAYAKPLTQAALHYGPVIAMKAGGWIHIQEA